MKKPTSLQPLQNRIIQGKKAISILFMTVLLLLSSCYDFNFVIQPFSADPNSFFEVQISVEPNSYTQDPLESYFGILMPVGWETTDSIVYVNTYSSETGVWIYSEHYTKLMTSFDPPPENYSWWVGTTYIQIESSYDIFTWNPKIYTDDQTGNFFLDYMIGDSTNGINFRRSNNHLILVGEATGCLPGGIAFSTQEEIDNFTINYPNCTEIAGNVTISGNITSLAGLDAVTSIGGHLNIEDNDALSDLSGLENLNTIGGSLSVTNNSSLANLSGLDNLNSIGRDLWIEGNMNLISLAMPESIGPVGENLAIINNDALTSLTGLEKVTSLGGCLRIADNESITNLSGLNYLTSIASGIIIEENNSLTNLTALDNLSSPLAWNLTIVNNFSLENLSGLGKIACLGGSLTIEGNESLTSLTDFKYVTAIGGDVNIGSKLFFSAGNTLLPNLSGLDHLISIGGTLRIEGNESLNSLSGLESLISIGGDGIIGMGYPGFSYGYISMGNPSLINMIGLNNLTTIGGSLQIHCNDSLTTLTGLENLETVGEDLRIGIKVQPRNGGPYYLGNPSLISIAGLFNLVSIGGDIVIQGNDILAGLSGIDNIDPETIANLDISYNDALSTCEVQSICDYLSAPNGVITIHSNAPGCNNPPEVAQACGNTMPCLTQGVYYFFTQAEIDNFSINYPGCADLEADVLISGNDIANLKGFNVITSIDGKLEIYNNPILADLSGLENVETITGDIYIYTNNSLSSLTGLEGLTSIEGNLFLGYGPDGNPNLASLAGLTNVTSIGGDLWIRRNNGLVDFSGLENLVSIGGRLNIFDNQNLSSLNGLINLVTIGERFEVYDNLLLHNLEGLNSLTSIGGPIYAFFSGLTSFTGLENLTTIGGYMDIRWNNSLTSLSGFDNIDPASIGSLQIKFNPSLCACAVQSMCEFLTTYNGNVHLGDNATGCNSKQEVLNACATSGCFPEGIMFSNQEEIDNFPINYPDCNEIQGDLTINGDDITDLSSLNILTAIGGDLLIGGIGNNNNPQLTNLTGLDNLSSVGGDFHIISNSSLSSLTGLENLSVVEGGLFIGADFPAAGNALLPNLSGLDNLTSIGGDLEIKANAALTNISALSNLTSLGGNIIIGSGMENITSNGLLTNLEGLEGLTIIHGDVWIGFNGHLTDLTGMNNVSSIEGSLGLMFNSLSDLSGLNNLSEIGTGLFIQNNLNLVDISSLDNLYSIGGGILNLSQNNTLTSLTGLDNITANSIAHLYIFNNDSLSECAVHSVCEYLLSLNGNATIGNNASGCSSPEEIESACLTSVDEFSFENIILISPNPCSDLITIHITSSDQQRMILDLFEVSGNKIKSLLNKVLSPGIHETKVDLSDIKEGMYFCVLKTNRGIQTVKLIKL